MKNSYNTETKYESSRKKWGRSKGPYAHNMGGGSEDEDVKENVGPQKLTRVTLDGIKQKGSQKPATFDVEPERVAMKRF